MSSKTKTNFEIPKSRIGKKSNVMLASRLEFPLAKDKFSTIKIYKYICRIA